MIIKIIFISF